MPVKKRRTTKLSVRTAGKVNRLVQICCDGRTLAHIESARASYRSLLGHDVSTSVIMRRSVAMLAQFLKNVHRGEEFEADELAFLMKSVR